MAEYIKREDALKAVDRVRSEIHKPHEKYVIGELLMSVFDSAWDACDRCINRTPAEDVAPKNEVIDRVIAILKDGFIEEQAAELLAWSENNTEGYHMHRYTKEKLDVLITAISAMERLGLDK